MKKILVLFILLTAYLFSQGWNNTVTTTISEPNLITMDLFTNKDGNHIITQNSNSTNSIKYYLLNSSGTVLRSSTIETSGYAQFPCISGDNDKVYLVYKIGNSMRLKKSTNAGSSWSNPVDQSVGSNTCNGVDIVYDSRGLHVVYSMQDNGSDYETYYHLIGTNNQWDTRETVTNYGTEVGGFPTVSVSPSRVHVSYNTGDQWSPEVNQGDAKNRDKYDIDWLNPQLVFSTESFRERIHAGSTKLFDFYYKLETGMGNYRSDLYIKERSLSGTTWSTGTLLKTYADVYEIVSATNTYDGKTHIVYEIFDGVGYRNYNGSSWSSESTVGDWYEVPRISSTSNDLFILWNSYTNYLQYRQYDAAPLTPSNLSISINSGDESVLSWTANKEPDVKISGGKYKIYRAETSGGEPTTFTLVATINAYNGDTPVTSWTDIGSGKSYTRKLFYKISAADKNLHESPLTNYVWRYGKIPKISTGEFSNLEYRLFDNYPNPFNPSTKISYSIKEEGLVTLKIYDILGKEIATIVNENKPSGFYEIEFNASGLSSGIYFYKLQSGNFTNVKKMLLTK